MIGATLFQGFDGVGIGMKAAGITPAWGIEWKDDVAQVARANGFHAITADILTVDPHTMERVDFLHASPPCTNASTANSKAGETELDRALGYKTAQFVEVLRPTVFTLENVWQYRNFEAFKFILTTLERLGYWVDVQHVNSADYGVPQTRRRMILRARLDGWLPHLPDPVRWVGWYEAIEDLIPTLPESYFAPWQLSRLPGEHYRAILVDGKLSTSGDEKILQVMEANEPSATVVSSNSAFRDQRAFIVPGGNATSFSVRDQAEPIRAQGDVNRVGNISRAYANGRVVSMTPRALARFQSFPDWYELPTKKALACYGIGNAVPPLMMQRIYEQLR